MAWSPAGVQTGTDTSLSGITTVTGVTSVTTGGFTIYTATDTTTLDIQGTQTIDPEVEKLVIGSAKISRTNDSRTDVSTGFALQVSSGGKLNLGVTKTVGATVESVMTITFNNTAAIGGFNQLRFTEDGSELIQAFGPHARGVGTSYINADGVAQAQSAIPSVGNPFYLNNLDWVGVNGGGTTTQLAADFATILPVWFAAKGTSGYTFSSSGNVLTITKTSSLGTIARATQGGNWITAFTQGADSEPMGGFSRFSRGTAIEAYTAQTRWWAIQGANEPGSLGWNCIFQIKSGGELDWRGATLGGYAVFNFDTGSSVLIQDGVVNNILGINAGTNTQTDAGRGSIFWIKTPDISINGLTILQSGEFLYTVTPTGTNGVNSNFTNGVSRLSAKQTVFPFFPNRAETAEALDFSIGQNGNLTDYTLQSANQLGQDKITNTTIINEAAGTDCFVLMPESQTPDTRNGGYVSFNRDINFDFRDGISLNLLSDGRYYIIDTLHSPGARKNLNSINDVPDKVYSGTFTTGELTSDQRIVLGILNAVRGQNSNTANDVVTGTTPNGIASIDLRGKVNEKGNDTFDIHLWRYENLYISLADTDMSDGTTGTLILRPRSVEDQNITNDRATIDALNTSIGTGFVVGNTSITTTTTSVNLDQVYDLVKYKKETSAANLIIPTTSTLVLDSDGSEIDLKALTITQGSGLWTVGSTHNKVSHDTLLDLSKFTLAGGIELTAPTLNNLPASIGTSILNPTNTIAGTGGHTSVSTSVINGDVDITGSSSNILGGSITGALDLKGGDTDFNGSVDEVGGITTGNITLGSTSLRTIDFKAGSTTKGTISASTVTNLVLDGTHEKAVTRSVGTATTSADGSIAGILTLGNGVLTSGSTFVCDETVTAGNGDHSVAGTIAKKLTLGNGDSTVNATVSSGGLDLGTGDQTINGNITGAVATDGTLTTGSTFIASSTVTASTATGDQSIDGTIAGDVTLGAATSGHTIDGALSSKLIMGTGAHTINGTVTSTINTTGTLTTGLVYSGGSTVSASGTGDSTIRGTTTGLLTLGNASVGHTLNGTFTGGFTIGTGASSFDGTAAADSQAGNGNFSFNGTLTGDFTHGTGTLVFGPSASMTGTLTKSGPSAANGLTLTTDQASTIDLVVTTGTLELFGAVRNDYNSVTGLTNDNAIPTTTTFQVGSGLPSGRVIFRERAAAAGTHLIDSTHTEGATTTLGVINNNSGSPTNYDIYYKPTNTFGDDGVFWAVTVVNSDNGATTNRTIDVTSTPHAGVLTRAAEDADLTGLTATMDAITTGTTGNINITGATTQIDAPQTQALMLRVTDDANYLNLLANTNAEMDDILPGIQSGSSINQSRLTLQATDQQSITALAGTGTGTLIGTITVGGLTFAAVFIFPNPSGLSGPEAQVACEAAIDGRAASGQSIQTAVTDCLKRGDLTEIGQE